VIVKLHLVYTFDRYMKNRESLIILLVIVALLGFIFCSIYTFYMGFVIIDGDKSDILNPVIVYLNSGLTGLVGGIVATGFGVENNSQQIVRGLNLNRKMVSLGSLTTRNNEASKKEKYGYIYALTYIVMGITSIVVWIILGDGVIESISNMAATFFGMVIPIVATFLSPN